jgi:hypothetical protein
MFIRVGWGARLREERERLRLNQQALTHRNTQRAYEKEATAPDLRYLSDIESHGLDVEYILTSGRSAKGTVPSLNELTVIWPQLSTEICAALLALARAAAGYSSGEVVGPTDQTPVVGGGD